MLAEASNIHAQEGLCDETVAMARRTNEEKGRPLLGRTAANEGGVTGGRGRGGGREGGPGRGAGRGRRGTEGQVTGMCPHRLTPTHIDSHLPLTAGGARQTPSQRAGAELVGFLWVDHL